MMVTNCYDHHDCNYECDDTNDHDDYCDHGDCEPVHVLIINDYE